MRYLSLCVLALPLLAGENAILTNGLRLRVERHEAVSGRVLLYTSTGVIDLPEATVAAFERDDYVPPPPPAAALVPPPVPVEEAKLTPRELVEQAAIKAELPPALVHSVARAESGYRTDALSPKGAIGLMQLMPATAAELAANPHVPKQNADAGARYLRDLLIKYDGNVAKALAAYNAGPGAVDRYNGVPPYAETVSYVNRVILDYKKRSGSD